MRAGNATRRWIPVVSAGAAALGIAFAAAWLLIPARELSQAEPVDARQLFSDAQLERMTDFRSGQRLIALASIALEVGLLAIVAFRLPLRERLEKTRRPVLAAGALAAAISLLLAIASIPLGLIAFERAREAGLVTQELASWLGDRALSALIATGVAAVAGAAALLLIRKLCEWWWVGGAALIVAYGVLAVWIWPVAISPLFNDFEPLQEGPARAEIVDLAERSDVEVGKVLVVDAARRSRSINAYVTGLGDTKRVVVHDNTLDRLERSELRSILAHELAHVKQRDVQRGLLWLVIVAPFGALFVHLLAGRLAAGRGVRLSSPVAIPVLALALSLTVLALGVPGAWLSRGVEAKADELALSLTGEPGAFIDLQRRIALNNLSDPDPPRAWELLFSSHPSTVERIGAARQSEHFKTE